MNAKSNIAKLPERCYLVNEMNGMFSTDAPVICIVAGKSGYYPIQNTGTRTPAEFAAHLNARYNAEPRHIAAMHIGSCVGWEVPGADCDNAYNAGA